MRTYTEEQVIAILDYIERNGFNDDCMTMNEELDHLNSIGVVKNCSIPDVVNRRELLVDFAMKRNNAPDFVRGQYERDADEYLSKIN